MFALTSHFYRLGAGLSEPACPQGIKPAYWVKQNNRLAKLLDISPLFFESSLSLEILSGHHIIPNSRPVAQVYAGHQFGKFNPFLGDGRSVLLGELNTSLGLYDLSLKGAGITPFTFSGDGRAALKECTHEYEVSEQLALLGIPTTGCLSITSCENNVYRVSPEPVAVLARVAPSFIRFGTFEACFFRKNTAALNILSDYVIKNYFPHIMIEAELGKADKYELFFSEVVKRTAKLIAAWQKAGFVHGMMNTDNQSIVGITLDLGHSTFTEDHDTNFVASPLDRDSRYAFGNQPAVGLWNCHVLARALSPLISAKSLKKSLISYEPSFYDYFHS